MQYIESNYADINAYKGNTWYIIVNASKKLITNN